MARRKFETSRWRNIRLMQLLEYPICEICNRARATEVHHIVKVNMGGNPLSRDNLQSTCHACHVAETKRQRFISGLR